MVFFVSFMFTRFMFLVFFYLTVFIICFILVAFHHIIQGPFVSSIIRYNQLVSTEFKVFLLEVSYIWFLITLCWCWMLMDPESVTVNRNYTEAFARKVIYLRMRNDKDNFFARVKAPTRKIRALKPTLSICSGFNKCLPVAQILDQYQGRLILSRRCGKPLINK